MIDALSLDDIRRWLRAAMPAGEVTVPGKTHGRDLPVKALARAVGIDRRDLYHMMRGHLAINGKQQARLTRFIRDWENGMLEFRIAGKAYGHAARKMLLVHRQTPRPRAIRMSVDWRHGAKLTIAPRVAPNPRIPQFRDLFAGLTTRGREPKVRA